MKTWMKWTMAVILLILAAGTGWRLLNRAPEAPASITMGETSFHQVVSATGRLVPASVVQVQSQVSGRLLSVAAAEGDRVQAGDVLAVLDDGDARRQITESRSSLTLAQAQARSLQEVAVPVTREELAQLILNQEQLERTLTRQESLYEAGALPLEPLEETRQSLSLLASRIRSAQTALAARQPGGAEAAETAARVAQAQSRVDTLETELAKYQLSAPLDGVVLERLAEPGELMQPGTVIFVLAAEEGYYAEVDLDERSMSLIAVGQEARLWPEAFPSRQVAARVESLAPRIDAETGTLRVRLVLTEPADFLIQDLTVQAEIDVRFLTDALLLPVAFLWETDPAVVLVAKGSTVEERPLTRVEQVSLNQLLVLEGLAPGEVVIDPLSGLAPGDDVRLLPQESGGDQ